MPKDTLYRIEVSAGAIAEAMAESTGLLKRAEDVVRAAMVKEAIGDLPDAGGAPTDDNPPKPAGSTAPKQWKHVIPEDAPAGWTAPYGADPGSIHTAVQDRLWPSAAAAKAGGVPITHNAAGRPMAGLTEEQIPTGVKNQMYDQAIARTPGGEWTRSLGAGMLGPLGVAAAPFAPEGHRMSTASIAAGGLPAGVGMPLAVRAGAELSKPTQNPFGMLGKHPTYPGMGHAIEDMATRGASQHAPGEGANAQTDKSAWGKLNAIRQRNAYEGEQAHPYLGAHQTIMRGIKSTQFVQDHPWAQRLVDPTNLLGPSKLEPGYTQDIAPQVATPAARMTYNAIAQPGKPLPSRFAGALNQGSAATPAQESAWRTGTQPAPKITRPAASNIVSDSRFKNTSNGIPLNEFPQAVPK